MPTAIRPAAVLTRYAIIDNTNPDVLYGEGTFKNEDAAIETADNLNALLSVDRKVYRAVAHVFTEELNLAGEEEEYLTVPERQQVPIDMAALTGPTPVQAPAATDEPQEPAEAPKSLPPTTVTVDVVPDGEPMPDYLR